jgi:hypothetical protein
MHKVDRNSIRENILMGKEASWENIHKRIKHYITKSYYQPGKLQIIFHNELQFPQSALNAEQRSFQFYDREVGQEEMRRLLWQFQQGFHCDIITTEACTETALKLKKCDYLGAKGGRWPGYYQENQLKMVVNQ